MHNLLPKEELQKLLDRPYSGTTLPRKIGFKNISFAKPIFRTLQEELKDGLHHSRKDSRKHIKTAYRLFLANFVACVFTKEGLSLPGGKKSYSSDSYFHKFFLTHKASQQVLKAMLQSELITKDKGNPLKKEVNAYYPTRKLEELVIPLIYSIVEEINLKESFIKFNKPKAKKGVVNKHKEITVVIGEEHKTEVHYVSLFSPADETFYLTKEHPDVFRLNKVNAALDKASFPLKGPIRRVYSNHDFMQGGRLYCHFQNLPERRARIRINTMINGEPIAQVDLSCNHAAMLFALEGKSIPEDFYSEITRATFVPRNKVKFLVTRLIGCKKRGAIDLRLDELIKDGFEPEDIPTHNERRIVEEFIKNTYPTLSQGFKKGNGVILQSAEGEILLIAMCKLIDKGIITLPIHDALAVPISKVNIAKEVLEESWMDFFDVDFRPHTKIDYPDGLEEIKLAA